jgi:UDP-2,4-diacetamido-2,4,6-trideoxy-beta-L-altropyranose hydrolase
MKIVFRVDSSNTIGTGHVRRCLILAEGLRNIGIKDIFFICSPLEGNIIEEIIRSSFEARLMEWKPDFQLKDVQQNRIPESDTLVRVQVDDAKETIRLLSNEYPNILIADSYLIAETWQNIVKPYVGSVVILDDLANRIHNCDTLIDVNFRDAKNVYDSILPAVTKKLCGTKYVLLSQMFHTHFSNRKPIESINRILVFFSGSVELHHLTVSVVNRLVSLKENIHIDVVVGGNEAQVEDVRKAIIRTNTFVSGPISSLVEYMKNADLAIGAGGVTTWERCYLGLPSIVVAIAKNQISSIEALSQWQYINYVGELSDKTPFDIEELCHQLSHDIDKLNTQTALCQKLVDGKGLDRILMSLLPKSYFSFNLRPATINDMHTYFEWVNDPTVRVSALQTEPIKFHDHVVWFNNQINSANSHLYVYECNGIPVGQVRFNISNGIAYIDYSIDELVRGKGIGYEMLAAAVERFKVSNQEQIHAVVKKTNLSSLAVFRKMQFKQISDTEKTISFSLK